ncbi:MAG: uncharacterized protein A8A55_2353 [Amphiamblys sp. WSBS2006]|nr:MAG: uncharacterized protein A8A55_2353 [Amphiamblys sp. WSBS2006]
MEDEFYDACEEFTCTDEDEAHEDEFARTDDNEWEALGGEESDGWEIDRSEPDAFPGEVRYVLDAMSSTVGTLSSEGAIGNATEKMKSVFAGSTQFLASLGRSVSEIITRSAPSSSFLSVFSEMGGKGGMAELEKRLREEEDLLKAKTNSISVKEVSFLHRRRAELLEKHKEQPEEVAVLLGDIKTKIREIKESSTEPRTEKIVDFVIDVSFQQEETLEKYFSLEKERRVGGRQQTEEECLALVEREHGKILGRLSVLAVSFYLSACEEKHAMESISAVHGLVLSAGCFLQNIFSSFFSPVGTASIPRQDRLAKFHGEFHGVVSLCYKTAIQCRACQEILEGR